MSVFKPLCRPLSADDGQADCYQQRQLILFDAGGNTIYLQKQSSGDELCFPVLADIFPPDQTDIPVYVGNLNGVDCFAAEFSNDPVLLENQKIYPEKLRMAYKHFSSAQSNAVARAKELLFWRKQHRFCGNCQNSLTEKRKV